MTSPVLICYDGSSEAEGAIDAAASILGPRDAVVLNVAPAMTAAEGMASTSTLVPGTTFEELNEAAALRCAKAGAEHARRGGLVTEAKARVASTTWRGIVDVADELDAAMIVIGSRGLRGLREFAGGSVSHDVARHARRPVLIVPPFGS